MYVGREFSQCSCTKFSLRMFHLAFAICIFQGRRWKSWEGNAVDEIKGYDN